MRAAFAVWITGLPASGKSTLARALAARLVAEGLDPETLESDALRRILTPRADYSDEDRDAFYASMAAIGAMLVRHGVPVIFDATANRRSYRERARAAIERFVEVYVATPLAVCEARDPKGIYRAGRSAEGARVPGLQSPYEPPARPDLTVRGDRDAPDAAAAAVVEHLRARGYLAA